MQIQRIQSVFLLIAAVIMALMCFIVPVAYIPVEGGESEKVYISGLLPVLVLDIVTALLLLVDIFLYKKLPLQMKVTRICIVLIFCSAAVEALVLYSQVAAIVVSWVASAVMLAAAVVLAFLALRGMKSDYKLLTGYNRLR